MDVPVIHDHVKLLMIISRYPFTYYYIVVEHVVQMYVTRYSNLVLLCCGSMLAQALFKTMTDTLMTKGVMTL